MTNAHNLLCFLELVPFIVWQLPVAPISHTRCVNVWRTRVAAGYITTLRLAHVLLVAVLVRP